jgi:adenosylcobinamide-GDP ribazoletransferase
MGKAFALSSMWSPLEFTSMLVCAAAVSRATMPVLMALQPSARQDGLAASAGQPESGRVLIGVALAVMLCLALQPAAVALPALLAAVVTAAAVGAFLGRRFGGCTGDTLGAVQQLAEIAFLFAATAQD